MLLLARFGVYIVFLVKKLIFIKKKLFCSLIVSSSEYKYHEHEFFIEILQRISRHTLSV